MHPEGCKGERKALARAPKARNPPLFVGRSHCSLNVKIGNELGIFLNKLLAGLHLIAHEQR